MKMRRMLVFVVRFLCYVIWYVWDDVERFFFFFLRLDMEMIF